jgi:hypothetical protein
MARADAKLAKLLCTASKLFYNLRPQRKNEGKGTEYGLGPSELTQASVT